MAADGDGIRRKCFVPIKNFRMILSAIFLEQSLTGHITRLARRRFLLRISMVRSAEFIEDLDDNSIRLRTSTFQNPIPVELKSQKLPHKNCEHNQFVKKD
jgi:hypothetical protein